MISVRQSLARRAAADPLWWTGSGWRTVGSVLATVAERAPALPPGRIAVACADDEALALALLAAEGRCEAVLLVPAAWDQATFDRYRKVAEVEALVTDRADLTGPAVLHWGAGPASGASGAGVPLRETRWILPTSGTTGAPKLVAHTLATLARTTRRDEAKGRELVWGLAYELARFAGWQVFLQALLGGSRLAFVRRGADVAALAAALVAAEVNAFSATPTLWRRMLMAAEAARLRLRVATLGGEIADAGLLRSLAARFPAARLAHVYASTEAGVGFSVTDGHAGFPARFLDAPPAGVALKVDADGTLWLRPGRAAQCFLGDGGELVGAGGWINSGDRVRREGERFRFLGRANGAINVGGNKVYPEEVEDCIRRVRGVRQVGVRARSNPLVGALVEACVLPEPDADRADLKAAIVRSCRATLAAYQVPAVVTWVDGLAVNAAGKLLRP